ncbi:MAG: TetR/AcrR family transcriptional regulator [Pseudomonadota bacterium]
MDGSQKGSRGRRGYHHGNLKTALVEATLALIEEKGPTGFTFADAARKAGVSPAAPYRHFKDREQLIAETARRGYELFADMLEEAWDAGRPTPLSAFETVGRAYLTFARTEPAYFTAMFEAGISADSDPALKAESERSFKVLYNACVAIIDRLPPEKRPPPHMMAYHIWALSHGVATLYARSDESGQKTPISPEDLLEAGSALYLRGIGFLDEG